MGKIFLRFKIVALAAVVALATGGHAGAGETPRLPFNPAEIPERPSGKESFRFVVISDLNGPYGSTTYNEHVHVLIPLITDDIRPELVLSAGDLIAGQRRGFEDEEIWAMWEGFTEAVTLPLQDAAVPFVPVAGNHDASGYPAFAHERRIYQEHWQKPEQRPDLNYICDENYPLYYTYHHKGAFFMVMDVTTLEPLPDEKWTWIEEQLAEAQEYSLRFASCHVPPFPVSHGREHEIIPAPDNDRLRSLFVEKNVDVFFTGHHHAYFKGRKKGQNLVSLNCAGSGPRPVIGTDGPQQQSFVVVDVVDGEISEMFALQSNEAIFEDETLPLHLEHGPYVLPRFDQD